MYGADVHYIFDNIKLQKEKNVIKAVVSYVGKKKKIL